MTPLNNYPEEHLAEEQPEEEQRRWRHERDQLRGRHFDGGGVGHGVLRHPQSTAAEGEQRQRHRQVQELAAHRAGKAHNLSNGSSYFSCLLWY